MEQDQKPQGVLLYMAKRVKFSQAYRDFLQREFEESGFVILLGSEDEQLALEPKL